LNATASNCVDMENNLKVNESISLFDSKLGSS